MKTALFFAISIFFITTNASEAAKAKITNNSVEIIAKSIDQIETQNNALLAEKVKAAIEQGSGGQSTEIWAGTRQCKDMNPSWSWLKCWRRANDGTPGYN